MEDKDKDVNLMAVKKEVKRAKKAYLNDFHMSASGEYVYEGKMWEFIGDEKTFESVKKKMLIVSIIAIIFSLLSGFIVPAGYNEWYVILPLAIELIFAISIVYYEYLLFKEDMKVRDYTINKAKKKLKGFAWVVYFSATLALIGDIIYVGMNGFEDRMLTTIIFMMCHIMCMVLSLAFVGFSKTLNYKVIN